MSRIRHEVHRRVTPHEQGEVQDDDETPEDTLSNLLVVLGLTGLLLLILLIAIVTLPLWP